MSMTLDEAKAMLDTWLKAEGAVAGGMQSYKVGGQSYTRANLADIANRVAYWQGVVASLERAESGQRSVRRVVLVDG